MENQTNIPQMQQNQNKSAPTCLADTKVLFQLQAGKTVVYVPNKDTIRSEDVDVKNERGEIIGKKTEYYIDIPVMVVGNDNKISDEVYTWSIRHRDNAGGNSLIGQLVRITRENKNTLAGCFLEINASGEKATRRYIIYDITPRMQALFAAKPVVPTLVAPATSAAAIPEKV